MEQIISEHAAFLQALKKGVAVCTTQEMYDHFLNVLPPRRMGMASFTFAEGDDSIHFWKEDGRCFARIGSAMVASRNYTRWVVVVARNHESPYKVAQEYKVPGSVGREFPDLESLATEYELLTSQ